MHHGPREAVRILSTRKVESVNVPRIAPLVKRRRRLIVLETTDYPAVYHHLGVKMDMVTSTYRQFI